MLDQLIWLIVVLAVIVIILIIPNVRIVPQTYAYVIQRLGVYKKTWKAGFHVKTPFIDKVQAKVNLKEQVVDFPPQPVITKDNVTMQIDTVVFYQITDPFAYTYNIANPMLAIANLTATNLRNLIGDLELDGTLTSRDLINTRLRAVLDEATDPWGIKVLRVELKNIIPPREIQDAMERQMKAERGRREKILIAEGEKRSAILIAEGNKEAIILNAEADKKSTILSAEASKEAAIRAGEGRAEAILKVQSATAEGIKMINESKPSNAVIAIRSLESLEKVADGKATKLIIPSEIQGLASLAASLKAVTTTDQLEV